MTLTTLLAIALIFTNLGGIMLARQLKLLSWKHRKAIEKYERDYLHQLDINAALWAEIDRLKGKRI